MDIKDYMPDTAVVDELLIEPKRIAKHDRNPRSDFPKKHKIGNRNYRLRSEVEAYKLKVAEKQAERSKGASNRRKAVITA